ncbi:MAG TPA: hypothetical protein VFE37_27020 [Chloroflexota bacterium]|nr:hypothetical protein [Chloroflexota bacterium]
MAAQTTSPFATCPPHHWLIQADDMGRDRWACQKCGLVRAEAEQRADARRFTNVCTWSRDEVALLDPDLE